MAPLTNILPSSPRTYGLVAGDWQTFTDFRPTNTTTTTTTKTTTKTITITKTTAEAMDTNSPGPRQLPARDLVDPRSIPLDTDTIQAIVDDLASPKNPPAAENGSSDILSELGRKLALSTQGGTNPALAIDLGGGVDRAWMLGMSKMVMFEREEHWERIVGSMVDRVVESTSAMLSGQEKLSDSLGLMGVVLSMLTRQGCIFCTDEWELRKTRNLSGPEYMRHMIDQHFNNGDPDIEDLTDEVLEAINADEMPREPPLPSSLPPSRNLWVSYKWMLIRGISRCSAVNSRRFRHRRPTPECDPPGQGIPHERPSQDMPALRRQL